MNELVQKLFADGIVSKEGVKTYLKAKNDDLKLFTKIQEYCCSIRKNTANLALIQTWRDWKFNDEMILEAAKRSATSANPIPYMNKILAEWKRDGIFAVSNIPSIETGAGVKQFVSPTVQAANAKTDRERYYAARREKAQQRADAFMAKANQNTQFKEVSKQLSVMEITLAKAEIFEPKKLPDLLLEKQALLKKRASVLASLQMKEEDLLPQYECKKCEDSGFLKNGKACDCYQNREV
jgi:protein involved in temperature-dependent protein secretion